MKCLLEKPGSPKRRHPLPRQQGLPGKGGRERRGIRREGKPEYFTQHNDPNPIPGNKPHNQIRADGKLVLATPHPYHTIWAGSPPGPDIREQQRKAATEAAQMAKKFKDSAKDLKDI